MTVATTLFDLKPGAELPSDADLRAEDAAKKASAELKKLRAEIEGLFVRVRPLSCEAKLEIARAFAKTFNGTTRMFNVAIFLRDKEQDAEATLFDQPQEDSGELELV